MQKQQQNKNQGRNINSNLIAQISKLIKKNCIQYQNFKLNKIHLQQIPINQLKILKYKNQILQMIQN